MRILVTGSAGHLGEALIRTLEGTEHHPVGLDIKASAQTHRVGSIANRDFVKDCMRGVDAVLHAATLHKPHIATHTRQDFIDTNITGTLNLLEEAVAAGARAFIYTSTTSVYVNQLARSQLGWRPRYDFHFAIERLRAGEDYRSPLAQAIGSKGYHDTVFTEGPYPV